MADLFWFSEEQWAVIEPFMPTNQPGARRTDDRRIISGIVHVLRSGCRWGGCPAEYGPPTTVYNRFNLWSRRGFWRATLAALAENGWITETAALDSTYVRAHRSAHGGKGRDKARVIGPSRGRQITEAHVLTDVLGRTAVIDLTPGNASDVMDVPRMPCPARARRRARPPAPFRGRPRLRSPA